MNKLLDWALAIMFLLAMIPLGLLCAIVALIDLVMGDEKDDD